MVAILIKRVKAMNERRITVPIKIDGLEDYKQKLEILQERLKLVEEAIEELNKMDITVKVNK